MVNDNKRRKVFLASVFFVLGFSIVFSLLGVLLQTILVNVSYSSQLWLSRIGGAVIIFFGLFMLGLIHPSFLLSEHKLKVKKFSNAYFTSFLFGSAFAVGWTPCVGAALGAILTLAATNASSAFFLLLAYTIGLGVPFLILGFFADRASKIISRSGRWLTYFQKFFGLVLIIIGILIFTQQLSRIANSQILVNIFSSLNIGISSGSSISSISLLNIGVSFLAGLASFLSPCVLPLLPGFLAYLASTNNSGGENE